MLSMAKLDEINRALRRRYPYLPAGSFSREATRAYLFGPSRYACRGMTADGCRARHGAWLEFFGTDEIVASMDIDRYLTMELKAELAAARREQDDAHRELLRLRVNDS